MTISHAKSRSTTPCAGSSGCTFAGTSPCENVISSSGIIFVCLMSLYPNVSSRKNGCPHKHKHKHNYKHNCKHEHKHKHKHEHKHESQSSVSASLRLKRRRAED